MYKRVLGYESEMAQARVMLSGGLITADEYAKKYNGLLSRYEKATARVNELAAEKGRKQSRERDLRLFIASIKKQPLVLKEWDERLWVALIDRATVYRDGGIVFRFMSGSEIEVEA